MYKRQYTIRQNKTKKLPLVVSSPSNASNASSTPTSPWHVEQQQPLQAVDFPNSPPTPASQQQQQQQRQPPLHARSNRRGSPARGFSLRSADFLDEDAVDVGVHPEDGASTRSDVRGGGFSGMGSGSSVVRDFTATRAASLSMRRLKEESRFSGSGDEEETGDTTG